MLISQNWITRLLRSSGNEGWSVTSEELDAGFVRVGFETEGYAPIEETTGPLVIGRVLEIEELEGFKKPIRYCQVDVGEANGTGEPQGIVCGARNFAEGDLVVVSLPGAVLPGGFEIAARKTYGKISDGMIASAAELGLTAKSEGIITLEPGLAEPGSDARDVLGLEDTVFEVNVTPDRGYALSARGLTREIASAFGLSYHDVAANPSVAGIDTGGVPSPAGELVAVDVDAETKTQRFGLRKVEGIDPTRPSPLWMQRELMLSGIRPVNAATDVTNYVMLLTGQPMHAFDADKISGGLRVRNAVAGESLETLDHTQRALTADDVVIEDARAIVSLAGIMGGASTEISEESVNVYFEAATWDPLTVARSARRHKVSSEASRRFERGVDPALVEVALDMACALLAAIAGGTIAAGRTLVGEREALEEIVMPLAKPGEITGVDYAPEAVVRRLEEVGCDVSVDGELARVVPPTWRTDLTVAVELVEEVVRLEGLDAIPLELPSPRGGRGLSPAQKRRRAATHALAYSGYVEVIPTPFIANNTFDTWGLDAEDARRQAVSVQNPLDRDYGLIATTVLPSMLEAVGRNVARGRRDLALFSVAQVAFARAAASPLPSVAARPSQETIDELIASLPKQDLHAATVATGHWELAGPWGPGRPYTWADAIESARVVAQAAGVVLEVAAADCRPWHPGRCAALLVGGEVVGYAGELHPEVLEALELPERTCAMELDLSALPFEANLPAPALSVFPALNQDIALVVDESVPAEAVRRAVAEGAGELVESVQLFDVYRSDQLGEGKKSLAFGLVFRAGDRTLTEDEASSARLAAAAVAEERFGAQMRA
ncbi:phenylalanine--tRNA ligase subunit beta [Corynebacterium liangguodongii]|uniref:Phenylalanine--tRNA ligase beta subunit n=1 Tax=Corynebacterium liangguodongii TaxID=2079535 RepID=A0A2S0WDW0_9CORY|nr:phenylalanine--tRNA ligase subunit beta [Corynebacterium liangguodongii]AWB83951.1 phenylalanine--tRNA ligase subunit beta [Corynebacterium liangguodongii]PWB99090.1 phenylalanine--tRNA ligase subunit beta [Corynebacterium liangguodongii]